MLLEGTKLSADRLKFNIKEEIIDESDIPHVVSCNSFTKKEWQAMHLLANQLKLHKEPL